MVNKPRIQAEGSTMLSMHIFGDGGLVAGIEKNDNALCRRDILSKDEFKVCEHSRSGLTLRIGLARSLFFLPSGLHCPLPHGVGSHVFSHICCFISVILQGSSNLVPMH
jgi:hypothetical protein